MTTPTEPIAIATKVTGTFDDVVTRTRGALAEQGFGILTEIDMQATLKAKLDEDMEKYLILGACNPPLAHRAVSVDRQIGLLLPCNVVVREDTTTENSFFVEAMNCSHGSGFRRTRPRVRGSRRSRQVARGRRLADLTPQSDQTLNQAVTCPPQGYP